MKSLFISLIRMLCFSLPFSFCPLVTPAPRRERTSRATNGQKGFQWAIRDASLLIPSHSYLCSQCGSFLVFLLFSVNLSVYVFTWLTGVRANNTFDFSIKARTSSLHRQIVTRSQRAQRCKIYIVVLQLLLLLSLSSLISLLLLISLIL